MADGGTSGLRRCGAAVGAVRRGTLSSMRRGPQRDAARPSGRKDLEPAANLTSTERQRQHVSQERARASGKRECVLSRCDARAPAVSHRSQPHANLASFARGSRQRAQVLSSCYLRNSRRASMSWLSIRRHARSAVIAGARRRTHRTCRLPTAPILQELQLNFVSSSYQAKLSVNGQPTHKRAPFQAHIKLPP